MSDILDVQNVYDGIITVQQLTFDDGEKAERVKHPTKAMTICHDPVNDLVMLVREYETGAMMDITRFPQFPHEPSKALHETVQERLEAQGIVVKGVQHVMSYMASPEHSWEPVELFYVNFDSRSAEELDAELLTAKELYYRVTQGVYQDIG